MGHPRAEVSAPECVIHFAHLVGRGTARQGRFGTPSLWTLIEATRVNGRFPSRTRRRARLPSVKRTRSASVDPRPRCRPRPTQRETSRRSTLALRHFPAGAHVVRTRVLVHESPEASRGLPAPRCVRTRRATNSGPDHGTGTAVMRVDAGQGARTPVATRSGPKAMPRTRIADTRFPRVAHRAAAARTHTR